MAIKLLSDLHGEFAQFDLPILDTDKDDILVLAGDIGVVETPTSFNCVKPWISRFKHTIMIQGNHESYSGSIVRTLQKQKDIFREELKTGKLSIVENEVIRVDNISLICATFWTDYYRGNPVIMQQVRTALNDYNYIRTGSKAEPYLRRINPHDIYNIHEISRQFIFDAIEKEKYIDGQKVCVVTHHSPSTGSIHPSYQGDPVNWGYVSAHELQIMNTKPDLWLHGHTHFSFDYKVGDTRIITNPRGYAQRGRNGEFINENGQFNPTLRIEV